MPSHPERVRRNYQAASDDDREVRRRLFAVITRYAEWTENESVSATLIAAVDALAAAAAIGGDVTSRLTVLDTHISQLTAGDTQTSLRRSLDALRNVLVPDARG